MNLNLPVVDYCTCGPETRPYYPLLEEGAHRLINLCNDRVPLPRLNHPQCM